MALHSRRPPRHTSVREALHRAGRALMGLAAAVLLLALLVGVPYGLARWVGWPLPHHWPTWTQTKSTLTGPFTDRILLDSLACLCWLIWAVFAADTIRAVPDAIRDAHRQMARPRPLVLEQWDGRHSGPLRAVATVLLAAIVTSLLSLRPHLAVLTAHASPAGPEARPATVSISIQTDATTQPVTAASASVVAARDAGPSASHGGTVIVQQPHDGIHDSLWRIAARCLGDGARWPEIYRLNYGLPQPDGGALTQPSLIQPGWILRLPTATPAGSPTPPISSAPGSHDGPTPRASHRPPPSKANPPTSTPAAPRPSASPSTSASASRTASPSAASSPAVSPSPSASAVHATGRAGGVDLGDGALVGFGLAGAVSAALLVTRRRRRRFYVPGSGRRDDLLLPVAPVVRTLHLAHVRATAQASDLVDADTEADTDPDTGVTGTDVDTQTDAPGSPPTPAYASDDRPGGELHAALSHRLMSSDAEMPDSASRGGVPIGVLAGQEVAVELGGLHGLGLAGSGAPAAARALIAHLLSSTGTSSGRSPGEGPTVLVPADTAAALQLPDPARLPARLRVTSSLAAALDEAETEILRHARLSTARGTASTGAAAGGGLVVVGSVPADTRRLQAILDAGSPAGVEAIMLGQWRPGTSLYVEADATVAATSPGPGEPLRGARLFCLTAAGTAELLGQLHAAEHSEHAVTAEIDATPDLPEPGGDRTGALSKPPPGVREASKRISSPARSMPSPDAHPHADGIAVLTPPLVTDPANATAVPDRPTRRDHHSARAALALSVLGPVRLTWTPPDPPAGPAAVSLDITGAVSARLRELLVLLAVHPDGITRDRLADTLWPDTSAGRPFATLNKNLVRLRHSIVAATEGHICEIVLASGDRHHLDPEVIATDFSVFSAALAARRAADSDEQRTTTYRAVVAAYRGELGEGLAAEWLETSREAVRRDAVDSATGLARLLAGTDVRAALDMLETGRAFDPYNEAIYCDIMRLQRRLRQPDAIERTLVLLTTRLAELDERPAPETLTLAHRLQSATEQAVPSAGAGPTRSTTT
jgi:DNA-binding SARP family transcriptional activator